jgi:hypothetical protein
MSEDLCSDCLRENIIAPTAGPTCRHQDDAGVYWWPAGWSSMHEHERVQWLEDRKVKNFPR